MEKIRVKDKDFTISITEEEILEQVNRVAAELSRDFKDKRPLFLSVLNGSFMFAADLMKRVNIPSEIQFVKLSSYQGTDSTGRVREMIGLSEDITGRTVVIVEDIVDTGITMKHLTEQLRKKSPAEIHICTLLLKPDRLQVDLNIEYVAMRIPNNFILGYGLDYDGYGRNLPDIYTLEEEDKKYHTNLK